MIAGAGCSCTTMPCMLHEGLHAAKGWRCLAGRHAMGWMLRTPELSIMRMDAYGAPVRRRACLQRPREAPPWPCAAQSAPSCRPCRACRRSLHASYCSSKMPWLRDVWVFL
jgi:hypothetical protein